MTSTQKKRQPTNQPSTLRTTVSMIACFARVIKLSQNPVPESKKLPSRKSYSGETNQLCRFSPTENCKTRTRHMYGGDCDAAIAKAAAAVTHVQSRSQEVGSDDEGLGLLFNGAPFSYRNRTPHLYEIFLLWFVKWLLRAYEYRQLRP